MGFLERIQDQPQSHHFLMELPAYSPMEDTDLDLWNAHEAEGEEEMGCILREREESLLLIPCFESWDCETGSDPWFEVGMEGKKLRF